MARPAAAASSVVGLGIERGMLLKASKEGRKEGKAISEGSRYATTKQNQQLLSQGDYSSNNETDKSRKPARAGSFAPPRRGSAHILLSRLSEPAPKNSALF